MPAPKKPSPFTIVKDDLPGHKAATVIRKKSRWGKEFEANAKRMEGTGKPWDNLSPEKAKVLSAVGTGALVKHEAKKKKKGPFMLERK